MKIYKLFLAFVLLGSSCNSNKETKKEVAVARSRFANTKDFICEMDVDNSFSDTTVLNGNVYAFCSSTCKDEFLKDPKKYLKK